MIERLKKLQATRGQFANHSELSRCLKSDDSLRREIDALSRAFLNKKVSGCSNCYTDAYFELITLSIDKAMGKSIFELKRGKLLRDVVNFDVSKNMTQANITDDLALYHLSTNPGCAKFFAVLPDNWEELVEAYNPDTYGAESHTPPGTDEKPPKEKKEKTPKTPKAKEKKEKTNPDSTDEKPNPDNEEQPE